MTPHHRNTRTVVVVVVVDDDDGGEFVSVATSGWVVFDFFGGAKSSWRGGGQNLHGIKRRRWAFVRPLTEDSSEKTRHLRIRRPRR